MSKDDYHVIAYQILSYLYKQLKSGEDVDAGYLGNHGPLMDINRRYWSYVMVSLMDYGFIEGCVRVEVDNAEPTVAALSQCRITPRGIEYLTENSFMKKAERFFKGAADIIPFVIS